MADRLYRPKPDEGNGEFPTKAVGHILEISGILFTGMGQHYLCMLPGNEIKSSVFQADLSYWQLTPEQWEAVVEASDDPQYLDALRKVWLRKSQRLISGLMQQKIWARDGYRCRYCNRIMGDVQLSVDHFFPLEMGGKDQPTNYLSACRKCNKEKGSMPPEAYCAMKGLDFVGLVEYLSHGDV